MRIEELTVELDGARQQVVHAHAELGETQQELIEVKSLAGMLQAQLDEIRTHAKVKVLDAGACRYASCEGFTVPMVL